jgi:aromatic ring-cleaving dioxygenase
MRSLSTLAQSSDEKPYLEAINHRQFSTRSTQEAFRAGLHDSFWQAEKFHIVLGSDSGQLCNYLISQGLPENSRYLFVEAEELIEHILPLFKIPAELTSHIAVCSLTQWQAQAERLGIIPHIYQGTVTFDTALAINHCDYKGYQAVANQLQDEVEAYAYQTKLAMVDKELILRCIDNLAENQHPAALLEGKFSHESCVILGAGPSLDEHIAWVKTNREQLTVIAVSRLATRLIREQLIPDIVISIDPMPVSFDVSKEMFALPSSTLFIHANHANSRLVGQWPHQQLFLGERYPWQSKANPHNFNNWGPNVANASIVTALRLGFGQILLSGIDLCFIDSNKRHTAASDTQQHHNPVLSCNQGIVTYDGRAAQTDNQMQLASEKLPEQIAEHSKPGQQVINLAGSARQIACITHQRCENITLANTKTNWQHYLTPSSNDTANYWQHCDTEINRQLKQLNTIAELGKKALSLNKFCFANNMYDQGSKAKLDKLQTKLERQAGPLAITLKKVGMRHFVKFLQLINANDNSSQAIERQGEVYYEAWVISAEALSQTLQMAKQRLAARQQERKQLPKNRAFIQQWQQDQQIGRSALWLALHHDMLDMIPKPLVEEIQSLHQQFEALYRYNIDTPDIDEQQQHQQLLQAVEQKQYREAEKIGAKLSQRWPKYQPIYAGILRLNGKHLDAINVYTSYLQQAPLDLNTWLALGQLYKSIEEDELADIVANYILEHEADYSAARALLKNPKMFLK